MRVGTNLLASGVTLLLSIASTRADIIYVDADAVGTNDGGSWINAFTDIQDALAIAQNGDTVHVAQGEYRPAGPGGSRAATFDIGDGVRLIGGYAGDGEVDPDAFDPESFITILSGDLDGDDGPNFANDIENAYHVVTAREVSAGTLLRGFTITGGRADGNDADEVGGGILCDGGVLAIRQCIIEGNRAYSRGGGVAARSFPLASRVRMSDCVIRNNTLLASVGAGAGASAGPGSSFTNCAFVDNLVPVAGSGGALWVMSAVIDGCEFIDNIAGEDGGALVGSDVTVLNTTFRGNRSTIWGGAALIGGRCEFRNCLFEDNQADLGGAIRFNSTGGPAGSLTVIESDFVDNLGRLAGGAIYNNGDGLLQLLNSRFLGNAADAMPGPGLGAGGAVTSTGPMTAVNSLFAGNQAQRDGCAISAGGTTSIINCTVVGNSTSNGGGAINAGGILNLHNCILWDNAGTFGSVESQQLAGETGAVFRIRNSNVQGWTGSLGGSHNNGDDPLLIDADGLDDIFGSLDDDPRLAPASPARNSGRNDLLPRDFFDLDDDDNLNERVSHDLDGDRRIRQGDVDRGAFESMP